VAPEPADVLVLSAKVRRLVDDPEEHRGVGMPNYSRSMIFAPGHRRGTQGRHEKGQAPWDRLRSHKARHGPNIGSPGSARPPARDSGRLCRSSSCSRPDEASNMALERTAGSHSLAAAAHRRRSAHKRTDQPADAFRRPGVTMSLAIFRRGTGRGTERMTRRSRPGARSVWATDYLAGATLRLLEEHPGRRRCSQASNSAVERTAGSHSLATAARRERSTDKGSEPTGGRRAMEHRGSASGMAASGRVSGHRRQVILSV
jgi:hypothetical protein